MKKSVIMTIGVGALVLAFLLVSLTTPSMVGPFGVLAVFILAYISLVSFIYLLLSFLVRVGRRVLPAGKTKLVAEGMANTKLYYFSSVLALAPVILVGMRSVGEIRLFDVSLLIAFEALAIFYISRRF